MQQIIQEIVHRFHDHACDVLNIQQVSGGCIHSSYVVIVGTDKYFIKLNKPEAFDVLQAEYDALISLVKLQSYVRYPNPLTVGVFEQYSFLLMEYLPIELLNTQSAAQLGKVLALQHKVTSRKFGWHQDNYLGLSKQSNQQHKSWVSFFKTERLSFQFRLAETNGCEEELLNLGDELMVDVGRFFVDYQPSPSLLHGDLWGGNAAGYSGEPFLFDPAVYYGDREADIAMTELFGGFPGHFYQAYNEAWPLDKGYKVRKQLYNLYHILNHYNLFGGGYYSQAVNMIHGLLKIA